MNQQPIQPRPQKPATSKWLLIVLIIVILAAAGFFSWYYLAGPERKVESSKTITSVPLKNVRFFPIVYDGIVSDRYSDQESEWDKGSSDTVCAQTIKDMSGQVIHVKYRTQTGSVKIIKGYASDTCPQATITVDEGTFTSYASYPPFPK